LFYCREGEAILKANSYYSSRRTRPIEITQKEVDLLKVIMNDILLIREKQSLLDIICEMLFLSKI